MVKRQRMATHNMATPTPHKTALWVLLVIMAACHSTAQPRETNTCGIAVCFAIDKSGSIGTSNFPKTQQFIIDVIDGVSEVADVAQFGAGEFATGAGPVAGLASMTDDADAAKAAINAMLYNGSGGTNMDGGIAACYRNENGVETGVLTRNVQPGLPRILFLITDGRPNYKLRESPPDCPCPTIQGFPGVCLPRDYNQATQTSECASLAAQNRAAAASAAGIHFISVGVTRGVNATFLSSLGEYYPVASFNELQDAVGDILRALCSDVYIDKSASLSPLTVGGNHWFTLDIVNTGKYGVGPPINFTDTLPAGLAYDAGVGVKPLGSSPPVSCSYDAGSREVSCSVNTELQVGRTWSYYLEATAVTAGNWTNTAEVFAVPDNDPSNNRDSVEVEVTAEPDPIIPVTEDDLLVSKTVSSQTVMLGNTFTYNITITNQAAQATANEAYAVDELPAGLQVITNALEPGCSWSPGTPVVCGPTILAPGASQTYVITVLAEYAGLFDNSAIMRVVENGTTVETPPVIVTVTVQHTCSRYELNGTTLVPYECGEGYRVNTAAADNRDPSQETCCIALSPDVSISKSVDPTSTIVGGLVNYTVTIRNTGDGNALDVILTDQLTEGLVFIEPLPEETARDCSFPDAVACDEIRRNNRSCAPGAYDTIICGPMTLSPDEVKVYTIPARAVLPGVWDNTVAATYSTPTNPTNQTVGPVTEQETVLPTCAHFNADGSPFDCRTGTRLDPAQANNTTPNQANCCEDDTRGVDVTIRKTVNTPRVLISNQVTYTLSAVNVGDRVARDVVVTDTLPLGFTFVTPLPAGCRVIEQQLTCGPTVLAVGETESYIIRARAVAAGDWDNSAVVTADNDINTSNNGPVVAPVTVTRTCGVYNSDGSRFRCSPGSRYNPEADNNRDPDQQICCIDCKTCFDFPEVCGTIDNGCGATIQCSCPAGRPFCIEGLNPNSRGYCSDQPITPTQTLDVGITKTGPDSPQIVGEEFEFLIAVVVEQGIQGAESVVMTDTLPAGLNLVSTAAETGSGETRPCDVSGRTITCDMGSMVLAETRFITVRVSGNRAGRFTNVARVSAIGDNNDSNDVSEAEVQVVCKTCGNSYQGLCGTLSDGCGGTVTCRCPDSRPFCHQGVEGDDDNAAGFCSDEPIQPTSAVDVSVTKRGPREGQVVGGEFDFELTVRVENGVQGAKNVVLKDTLPTGFELVAVEPGSACSIAYPVITCIYPLLALAETQQITVRVKGSRTGRFVNRAVVTADNDTDTTNNRDTAAVSVVAGSCCNLDGSCSQIPQGQCSGTYQVGASCSADLCQVVPTTGACCLRGGGCRNNVESSACASQGGQYYPDRRCAPGLCAPRPSPSPVPPSPSPGPTPPGTLGSCCVASARTCFEGVTKVACDQRRGQWRQGATCTASFCLAAAAACCVGGGCFDVTSQQCAAQGGTFNAGRPCSSGVCSAANCTPSWLPCIPCTTAGCTDQCCSGSSCKPTLISGRNFYSCKPDDICRAEGQACGNCKGGGVCCSGLVCRWQFKSYTGICTRPQTCSRIGGSCAVDADCCPGGRCGADRRCRVSTCSKKCGGHYLGPRTNKCPIHQQHECGAWSAAAASNAA